MFAELTVIIKDDEKTLRKKFPIYESFACTEHDPTIKNCIDEVMTNFNGEPDHIKVNILMVIQ